MKKSKKLNTRRVTGFVFLIPALLFILYATVVPFAWNLVLSFQKWDGFGSITFRGIQNLSLIHIYSNISGRSTETDT